MGCSVTVNIFRVIKKNNTYTELVKRYSIKVLITLKILFWFHVFAGAKMIVLFISV